MNRQEIINALENKGFSAKAVEVSKNNVIMKGIQFTPVQTVSPIIYTDEIITRAERDGLTVETVADEMIKLYEARNAVTLTDNIMDQDYIREHVRIGLQRATAEEITKRSCALDAEIEEFLFVPVNFESDNGYGSFKVNAAILEKTGLDATELWTCAERNTFKDTEIKNMMCIIAGMTEEEAELFGGLPLYVCRAGEFRGASAILDRKALKAFAEKHSTKKIIVIPSSIHECIVIPHTEDLNIDDITKMVREVNGSQVDPVDQLADKAYIINI